MAKKAKEKPFTPDAETLDKVILLVVSLQSKAAVEKACVEGLKIAAGDVESVMTLAAGRIVAAADVAKDRELGTALLRLNDCYERSLRVQDVKTALAAQKELNRLLALQARRPNQAEKPAEQQNPLTSLKIRRA